MSASNPAAAGGVVQKAGFPHGQVDGVVQAAPCGARAQPPSGEEGEADSTPGAPDDCSPGDCSPGDQAMGNARRHRHQPGPQQTARTSGLLVDRSPSGTRSKANTRSPAPDIHRLHFQPVAPGHFGCARNSRRPPSSARNGVVSTKSSVPVPCTRPSTATSQAPLHASSAESVQATRVQAALPEDGCSSGRPTSSHTAGGAVCQVRTLLQFRGEGRGVPGFCRLLRPGGHSGPGGPATPPVAGPRPPARTPAPAARRGPAPAASSARARREVSSPSFLAPASLHPVATRPAPPRPDRQQASVRSPSVRPAASPECRARASPSATVVTPASSAAEQVTRRSTPASARLADSALSRPPSARRLWHGPAQVQPGQAAEGSGSRTEGQRPHQRSQAARQSLLDVFQCWTRQHAQQGQNPHQQRHPPVLCRSPHRARPPRSGPRTQRAGPAPRASHVPGQAEAAAPVPRASRPYRPAPVDSGSRGDLRACSGPAAAPHSGQTAPPPAWRAPQRLGHPE